MTTLASLGSRFVPELLRLSARYGIDPKGAVQVMLYESGLQPAIMNSIGAVGLNQFIPSNYGSFAPLSVQQYQALSATQQLPYVFKFWGSLNRKGQKVLSARDLYWLNILPATFVPNAPDSYVVMRRGDSYYGSNTNLDHGSKGYITAGDFALATQAGIQNNRTLWSQLVRLIGSDEIKAAAGALVPTVILGMAAGVLGFLFFKKTV